jgi:hypothetical protein
LIGDSPISGAETPLESSRFETSDSYFSEALGATNLAVDSAMNRPSPRR